MSLEPGIERSDEFTAEGSLHTDVRGTLPVKVLVGFEVCVKHVAAAPEGAAN